MVLREGLRDVAGELAQELAHRRGVAAGARSLGSGLETDVPAQQRLAPLALEQRPAASERHLAAGIGAELGERDDNLCGLRRCRRVREDDLVARQALGEIFGEHTASHLAERRGPTLLIADLDGIVA